jgi:hypothetical protein
LDLAASAGPAIPGLQFWVVAWYLILTLGVVGLVGALCGRQRGCNNRDEIFRGVGTVAVALGMLFLLHGVSARIGQVLIAVAVASFVLALRERRPRRTVLTLIRDHPTAQGRFP